MGLMRFIVSPADRISDDALEQVYLAGLDRVPWHARVSRADGELRLERKMADAGNLYIPWQVEGYGWVTLATGTLIERERPYHLPLELARGKIGQVRNQISDWQAMGLFVPVLVEAKIAEATRLLGEAAVGDPTSPRSVQLAEQCLRLGLDAAHLLTSAYAEQVLAVRRRTTGKLGILLGSELGNSPLDPYLAGQYLQSFNAARIPMAWRTIETGEGEYHWDVVDQQVEWCRAQGLMVCAGPLIQLDRQSVPDWLYLWEKDFESLLGFATEFLDAVVNRYRDMVDLWVPIGRINTANVLSLDDEERLRLTAQAIEVTRGLDALAEVVVSFDQPWGEYLSRLENDFPPLHFADELLRAGLGLTGLGLEINLGYQPDGTLLRDPLEFSRHLDYWSLLGAPLYLAITVPSGSHDDPLAQRRTAPQPGTWTPGVQQAWVNRYVPMLLAKSSVHGVLWNQLRDSEPHAFPHGGLFDLRRHPKPALRQLASLRQAYLR